MERTNCGAAVETGKRAEMGPPAFRPIWLINVLGKVLKHAIRKRLETAIIREGNRLSSRYFNFRIRDCSDVYVSLVLLDLWNALDTAKLKRGLGI